MDRYRNFQKYRKLGRLLHKMRKKKKIAHYYENFFSSLINELKNFANYTGETPWKHDDKLWALYRDGLKIYIQGLANPALYHYRLFFCGRKFCNIFRLRLSSIDNDHRFQHNEHDIMRVFIDRLDINNIFYKQSPKILKTVDYNLLLFSTPSLLLLISGTKEEQEHWDKLFEGYYNAFIDNPSHFFTSFKLFMETLTAQHENGDISDLVKNYGTKSEKLQDTYLRLIEALHIVLKNDDEFVNTLSDGAEGLWPLFFGSARPAFSDKITDKQWDVSISCLEELLSVKKITEVFQYQIFNFLLGSHISFKQMFTFQRGKRAEDILGIWSKAFNLMLGHAQSLEIDNNTDTLKDTLYAALGNFYEAIGKQYISLEKTVLDFIKNTYNQALQTLQRDTINQSQEALSHTINQTQKTLNSLDFVGRDSEEENYSPPDSMEWLAIADDDYTPIDPRCLEDNDALRARFKGWKDRTRVEYFKNEAWLEGFWTKKCRFNHGHFSNFEKQFWETMLLSEEEQQRVMPLITFDHGEKPEEKTKVVVNANIQGLGDELRLKVLKRLNNAIDKDRCNCYENLTVFNDNLAKLSRGLKDDYGLDISVSPDYENILLHFTPDMRILVPLFDLAFQRTLQEYDENFNHLQLNPEKLRCDLYYPVSDIPMVRSEPWFSMDCIRDNIRSRMEKYLENQGLCINKCPPGLLEGEVQTGDVLFSIEPINERIYINPPNWRQKIFGDNRQAVVKKDINIKDALKRALQDELLPINSDNAHEFKDALDI